MPSRKTVKYITDALDIVQEHSLYRHKIDWPSFRSAALTDGKMAATVEKTYPALRRAVMRLGNHGGFVTPVQKAKNDLEVEAHPTKPSGHILIGKIGYLQIPSFGGSLSSQADRFAQQTQNLIKELDSIAPLVGWIVDLRENGGGNRWPMLAGLGPLLEENRPLGTFIFPSGTEHQQYYRSGTTGFWLSPEGPSGALAPSRPKKDQSYYRNGTATFDGKKLLPPPPQDRPRIYSAQAKTPYQLRQRKPVAVLMGRKTASAAEAVVLAFRGRPLCRTFGAPTAGLITAVAMAELSDGALILFAAAVNADWTGQQFTSGIPPDVEVADDDAVTAASSWLRKMEGKC